VNSSPTRSSPSSSDDAVDASEEAIAVGLNRGRLAIILAAVLWSTSGFFAKAPWFEGWSQDLRGMQLAFWRALFAAVALAPFVRKPRWHWAIIPTSLCFAVMVWTFMAAMVHGPAANAIWLQYLAPAWVLLIGVVILGERVSRSDLQMFTFCLSGVLLILAMELRTGGSIYATGLGILSSVMFSIVVTLMRRMRELDAVWVITLNHIATVLVLLPWIWQQPLSQIEPPAYLALALFGVFQLSVPYILFCRALRTVPGPEASILTLLEPILLPLWVYIAWRHHPSYEAPRWWTLVGGTLILVGLLIRYLPMVRARMSRIQ
jgi:drug/metabolite transporter, DME family